MFTCRLESYGGNLAISTKCENKDQIVRWLGDMQSTLTDEDLNDRYLKVVDEEYNFGVSHTKKDLFKMVEEAFTRLGVKKFEKDHPVITYDEDEDED